MLRRSILLLAVALTLALSAFLLRDQSPSSEGIVTVHGLVTRDSGAGIARATISFQKDTLPQTMETGRDGSYSAQLPPGEYEVRLARSGFARMEQKMVVFPYDQTLERNFRMEVQPFIDILPVTPVLGEPATTAAKLPDKPEHSGRSSKPQHPQQPQTPLNYSVKMVQAWIPMKDGVRLAANLFMPEGGAGEGPVPSEKFPAILEYLPYRKDDWGLARDWEFYPYFVERGYVVAAVDIRGTGASEGAPPDREYSDIEHEDGMQVIDWLSKQPWSNGNVGMMGISWGGFNSIQMAGLHPPALKAILAACATEDLFHDDVHYFDGLMHADEFEMAMDLQLALTRAPDFPTDEKSLAPRFDASPWFLLYLHNQRNGPFWMRASVAKDYSAYTVPTFLIGGFLDGYRDNIPRFFENVHAPLKALLGPWNHTFPDNADPGPAIEWRDQAVRWFDYWMKGKKNGILDEPRLQVFLRHWYPPDPNLHEIPGVWRAEKVWPAAGTRVETLYPTLAGSLAAAPQPPNDQVAARLRYVPSIGIEAGFWWGDLTADQRPIDAYSLVYDSPPLAKDEAILGRPVVQLNFTSGAPLADWFARLEDVAPDGTVTLVTGAGMSGAQRRSSTEPQELDPRIAYTIPIELHVTSWVFPAGHRIRLSISNALWPMIWPTPYPMTTQVWLGGEGATRLELPVIPIEPPAVPQFSPPSPPPPSPAGITSEGETWPPQDWNLTHDLMTGITRVAWSSDDKSTYPWGKMSDHEQMYYEARDADPAFSSTHGEASTTVDLPGRLLVWSVVLDLKSDEKNFYYHFERRLRENGALVREKKWDDTIPRDFQ
jgi:uncharacterized protein